MKSRKLHNIAVMIVVAIMFMVISTITYMGIMNYKLSHDAKNLNDAVETSVNIAELGNGVTSVKEFINMVDSQHLGEVRKTETGFTLTTANNLTYYVIVKSKDSGMGSMLSYNIVSEKNGQKIYKLESEKYLASGKQGEN